MRLFTVICLLAASPIFVAAYFVDLHNHQLSRRSAELMWNGDGAGFEWGAGQQAENHERFARGLSPGAIKDLKAVFNVENFLSMAQKFIKISVKIVQTITGFIPASSVKEGIGSLGFPGANALAKLVEEGFNFIHDLTTELSNSEFLTQQPTKKNFIKMLSDGLVLTLKKTVRFTSQLKKTAEKAFDDRGLKYDVLHNVEITHPFAKKVFVTGHKVIKQIANGVLSFTSPTPRETISGFIKSAPLPHANELGEIVNGILQTTNEVSQDLLDTNFLKEEASINNVNCFVVTFLKSLTIKSLQRTEEVLKVILTTVLKMKGLSTEINTSDVVQLDVPAGIAIDVINKVLSFFVDVDAETVLKVTHKFISLTSKVVYDVTSDSGIKIVPEMIRVVGKEITEFSANAAEFLIGHLNRASLATTQSKFVNEAPSWENAKDYLLDSTKYLIKFSIEVTNKIRKYFDETVAQAIMVPSLVKDILEALIPEEIISNVQTALKSINRGVQAVTGPLPVGAIRGFIRSSNLPFSEALADIVSKIMTSVNNRANMMAMTKFFTEAPTVENAALSFTEIVKESISSSLKLLSEILEIILSTF